MTISAPLAIFTVAPEGHFCIPEHLQMAPRWLQGARQLGISEKSLRKWLRLVEPPIEAKRHKYDLRYLIISDEDVQRIQEARAERPGAQRTPAWVPSYTPTHTRNALRGDSDVPPISVASPTVAPTPHLRVPRATGTESRGERHGRGEATGNRPNGMMSITEAERLHGIPASNTRHWTNQGIIETDPGTYLGEHDILAGMPKMPDTSIKSAGQAEQDGD